MTDTYATADDLEARLSASYTAPADPTRMLVKASEVVNSSTRGRAQAAWSAAVPDAALVAAVTQATCDQVEFWLEVGEEHDVSGLHGSVQLGRVQVNHLPGDLGQRARRTLTDAGLLWAGAGAM